MHYAQRLLGHKIKKDLSTLAKPSMDVTKAPEGITGHVIDSGRDKKEERERFPS